MRRTFTTVLLTAVLALAAPWPAATDGKPVNHATKPATPLPAGMSIDGPTHVLTEPDEDSVPTVLRALAPVGRDAFRIHTPPVRPPNHRDGRVEGRSHGSDSAYALLE